MLNCKESLNIVAIIPARGGSKGLKNKNLQNICGHPLITWSINQAKLSKLISSIWVSSDDDEILETSSNYGANIIKRPQELASDNSSSESAWIHAVDFLNRNNIFPDIVIGMQATSPIRESKDLDKAIHFYKKNNYDSLLSVSEIEDYFVWGYNSDSSCEPKNYDLNNRKPRQEIQKNYLENGSFYIFKPFLLKHSNNRLSGKIGMYSMEKYKSFQIDSKEDLKICSGIMQEFGIVQSND